MRFARGTISSETQNRAEYLIVSSGPAAGLLQTTIKLEMAPFGKPGSVPLCLDVLSGKTVSYMKEGTLGSAYGWITFGIVAATGGTLD